MALKDLIAQNAQFAEQAVESIVADFVRFDPAEKLVIFTDEVRHLTNREKLLVYLVALQGWRFVTEEKIEPAAKPAEIAERTGILVSSLRPLLSELKGCRMIADTGGRYFASVSAYAAIKETLARSRPTASDGDDWKRPRKKRIAGQTQLFESLISDGFFDTRRSYMDVHARFRKDGVVTPRTGVTKYLMRALRDGKLEREKKLRGKREVWLYRRVKQR